MSDAESDSLVPEEELLAALAEVEKISGEEAARIPSLDDGCESADDAASPVEGADLASSQSTEGATPPAAVPSVTSESLADEQLRAALAEVETASSGPKDAPGRRVAAVTGSDQPGAGDRSDLPADPKAEKQAATAEGRLKQKKLHVKVGGQPGGEGVAEHRPPDGQDDAEATGGIAQPVGRLVRRVYRAVDRGLETLNRPFAGLDNAKRALVGWVALTTLIISILAMVVVPIILPHRNAIMFLEEKRAQLDAPPPAADMNNSAEADD